MAGTFPRPKKKSDGTKVEFLDWARLMPDLALAETTLTHRNAGWSVESPSYIEKNYLAQRLARWVQRAAATGLFIESCEKTITVGGTIATGDERIAVIDGTINVTYVTSADDSTNDEIAAGLASALQANAAVMQLFEVSVSGAVVTLRARLPGYDIGVATTVTPASGTPTAVVANVRVAPYRCRLSDEDLDNKANIDFVFGSSSTENAGAGGESRMLFDKSKGAWRAGWTDAGEWDDGSRGYYSAAWGRTCTAPSEGSTAGGYESFAGGQCATAIGYQCNVSGNYGVAMGLQCSVTGVYGVAMGALCVASSSSVAMGANAEATGGYSVAMGHEVHANANSSVAVGAYCLASALGAMCTGAANSRDNLQANGLGARAHGHVANTATGNTILASGDGADAHGSMPTAITSPYNGANASGDLSRAHGRGVTASGHFSRAYGDGAVAAAYGEVAHASGAFSDGIARKLGSAQSGSLMWLGTTTNNTATPLQLGGSAGEWAPPAGSYCADLMVVANIEGTPAGMATWRAHLAFRSDGSTTVVVLQKEFVDGANGAFSSETAWLQSVGPAWVADVGPSGGNLQILVTGALATTIRWVAKLDYIRVG